MPTHNFDPVSLSIMWDRLVSITNEIVEALVHTSFSTIVRENYDLACMLFDADGRILAQGTFCQPVFIGTGPHTVRKMLEQFPAETLEPGDVLFTNDAWIGTGHLWDVNVLRPVFYQKVIVGYTLSISHLPDIGGRGLSAENVDIYEDGLQIPICKLFSKGRCNDELVGLIRQNVRVSEQVIGDLMANVTCTKVGEKLLLEFMQEYQLTDLRPLAQTIVNYTEQAMRTQIGEIPDGVYNNEIQVEAFDTPVTLKSSVRISGDRLQIDYTGSSEQLRYGINVPLCYTRAMSCYAVKCLTIPGIPNNEGSVQPVELIVPPHCILNAQPPAATGARLLVGHFVVPLLFGAFSKAVPNRVQADPGMMNVIHMTGQRKDQRDFSTMFFSSGGLGAMNGLDGQSATVAPANMKTMPAEIWESMTNLTLVERRFRRDSGGAGEFRGGLGQTLTLRNDTGRPVYVALLGSRTEFPARGFSGGRDAALRRFIIDGEVAHPKGRYVLHPGARITVEDSGGGGFGDPHARSHDKIQSDITAGFISQTAVREVYSLSSSAESPTESEPG